MKSIPVCHHCGDAENFPRDPAKGRQVELRPYGPGGAQVCFQCAMEPKNKKQTERNYGVQLETNEVVGGGAALLTSDGPVPFSEEALNNEAT